jgi:Ca-activated chloride channel family protein
VFLGMGVMVACIVGFGALAALFGAPEPPPPTPGPATAQGAGLSVAVSPEKSKLLSELVRDFNAQGLRTPDRQAMTVNLVEMAPDKMVEAALSGAPEFQALNPDSSLWLDQLNRRWSQAQAAEPGAPAWGGIQASITGNATRYAVTPIVVAAWEEAARDLGWPEKPVGWKEIREKALQDPNFRWSHPSTAHASGLLATLSEFYAGAGVDRGLTAEMATSEKTLGFVSEVEKTVRFYGEGELALIQRAAQEGQASLDAFVVPEQLLVAFNQGAFGTPPGNLVALYPAEGTLWADHPLALLESGAVTQNQRRTFEAFREYLLTPETQSRILKAGYRPADLSIPLGGAGSPLTAANGVDPTKPQTTLQLPPPDVVSVVQNAWALAKRKANIILVVDTSGSMAGAKLANAQQALRTFLAQVPTDQERVGLVEFSSNINNIIEPAPIGQNRAALNGAVDTLYASGNTAFLDAVEAAYERLQNDPDPERINAIVAMTDGRENASAVTLRELAGKVRAGNRQVPVIIFSVAYGRDADLEVLQTLADVSGGQVRAGTPETIRELYQILSSYF